MACSHRFSNDQVYGGRLFPIAYYKSIFVSYYQVIQGLCVAFITVDEHKIITCILRVIGAHLSSAVSIGLKSM